MADTLRYGMLRHCHTERDRLRHTHITTHIHVATPVTTVYHKGLPQYTPLLPPLPPRFDTILIAVTPARIRHRVYA